MNIRNLIPIIFKNKNQGTTGPVTNPTIAAIQALSPVLYYDFRFPSDPVLGQLMYQDDLATTPVTATTQSIGYIENLGSLSSAPLIQAGVTNKPIWIDTTDGAFGDGIDDYLVYTLASPLTGTPAETVFSGIPDALNSTTAYLVGNSAASYRMNISSAARAGVSQGSILNTTTGGFPLGVQKTINFVTGATDEIYVDGVFNASGNAGTNDWANQVGVFGRQLTLSNYIGTVKTVLFFDRNLTSGERATLQGLIV